ASPDVTTTTAAGEPITIEVPIWVDSSPQFNDTDVVPAGVEALVGTPPVGLEVVQPEGDTGATRPAGDTGPVEVEEVDVIVAEALHDEVADADSIDPSALNLVLERDASRDRFIDPCSAMAEGACPFGVPAMIALDFTNDGLGLVVQTFRGDAGLLDAHGNELCPPDFVAGEFNIAFQTTAPATIEFAYGTASRTRAFEQRTIPSPQPGQPEYERWIANMDAGLLDPNRSAMWVRTCAALDLDQGTIYTFTPVVARTDDGIVSELGWVPSLDTRPPAGSIGRPPTSIVTRGDGDAFVYVWSRNPDEGYQTVVWPIDTSQPDASSCSEIEDDLFFMRRWGMQHPDLGMAIFNVIPIVERTPPRVYSSEWSWRQRFDLSLREGRVYTLCTWEARLGEQSFDQWEILEREQQEIVTPNRHPIVVTLTEADVSGASTRHTVEARLNPRSFCDTRAPQRATVEAVTPGMAQMRQIFCETRGIAPDPTAFVDLYVDDERTSTVAMPLRTDRGCKINGPDLLCSNTFSEYFDASAEIPGSCDTQCAFVDVRIRVDYLSSNGEGSDRWLRGAPGTFTAAPPPPDSGPAVDIFDVELTTVPGRVDALETSFTVDRPVTFELEVLASGRNEPCNQIVSGTGDGRITVVAEGLCADTLYTLGEITLTDAAGVTNRQYLSSEVRAIWTYGYASDFNLDLRFHSVDDEAVAVEHCRTADRTYGGVSGGLVGDRCWENLAVSPASRISIGNTSAIPFDRYVCPGDVSSVYSAFAPALDNRPQRVAVHGEDVPIDIYIILNFDPSCGNDPQEQLPVSIIDLDVTVTLEDLDDIGWGAFLEVDGILWEIYVGRVDRGIAHRLN
ncbi:MAG: hypothetical protein M3094_04285, partial [Actinomycetia bacterium]|nr:hypothetical protein [Actinomycetes bacterium]